MQLIQYAPTTETVLKAPLLIVPPWINKFYVLDLTPEKSFIKWCVDQGLTVFVISWVNPDERLAEQGLRATTCARARSPRSTSIEQATGENKVHAIGYCVGGTLLVGHARLYGGQGRRRASRRRRCSPRRSISPMPAISRSSSTRSSSQALEAADGRARLSRRHEDGDRLQHAALQRPDLALRHQQLPARQGAASRSTCCTGIPTRRACRRPTTPSICATAISRTRSPRAR